MKYGINTNVNSLGEVISSCLEDYKAMQIYIPLTLL